MKAKTKKVLTIIGITASILTAFVVDLGKAKIFQEVYDTINETNDRPINRDDMLYYGCPNSNRVKRLNTKKNRRALRKR